MDRFKVEQAVLKILSAMLKCEVDLNSSRRNTPQWDSLKHIEVVFALEEDLGLEFTEDEMAKMDNVTKIVEVVLRHNAS